MKSGSGQSILLYLLASTIILISGCSETTKEAPPQYDLVFPVSFPFINDSNLYSIEDKRFFGESSEEDEPSGIYEKLLFEIPSGLLLALDTDPSDKITENDEDVFTNTALPEFIAYVKNQTLHLYDLSTRYDHELYSFENDPYIADTGISKPRFICDIQKVVTWDEEARLAKTILFKDELAVYVKTSTLEACAEPEEGFQYWQINIVESTETFTIRRKTLKTHTHEHRHFHNHDDPNYEYADIHDHIHLFEEGELDDSGEKFKLKDHTHKHGHSHDFIYNFLHEHDHINQDELDDVHNDPTNHEIVFETQPLLIGRKTSFTSLDEALMYSGQPVINLNAKTFGYLGLNSDQNTFKFFNANPKTLEKNLLWSAQSEKLTDLINNNWKNTNWQALVPKYNHFINYTIIESNIIVFTDKHLFLFSAESLFDDDAVEERTNSLANPLFTSSYSSPRIWNRTHYNASNNKMVITENNQLWQIDFEQELPQAMLIRTFNDANLVSIEAKKRDDEILVIKRFNENDTIHTSISSVQDNGLETTTIVNKTTDTYSVFNQDGKTFLNIKPSDPNNQIIAKLLFNDVSSYYMTLTDTIWLKNTLDYRTAPAKEPVSLFSSDFLSAIPGTIEEPDIYVFDINASLGRGEHIGNIPDTVSEVSDLVLFNENYTIIDYQNGNNESRYWYLINNF